MKHKNELTYCITIFLVSYLIFWLYGLFEYPDYWGDSYHNVYMSWLTLKNDWIYSDYKGRHLAWLPLHTYFTGWWMNSFESFTLETVHFFNRMVGSGTVVMVYVLSRKILSQQTALLGAIVLSLTPFWILYSNLNMSEGLTAFLLIAVIAGVVYERPSWVFALTFLGFFSRYEFTPLIGVFGLMLLSKKSKTRYFWILFMAGFLAFAAWCWWSYYNTGYMLDWILQKGSNVHDARFNQSNKTFYGVFISWWIALPVLPVIMWGLFKVDSKRLRKEKPFLINLLVVLLFHWVAILIGQIWFTSYPDPKYFIISLPIASVLVAFFIDELLPSRRKYLAYLLLLLGLFQLPFFYFQSLSIDQYLTMGELIRLNETEIDGNLWIDFPPAQIESGLEFGRFYTSEMMVTLDKRGSKKREVVIYENLESFDISYIMSYPASYSIVLDVWPDMKNGKQFKSEGITFTPYLNYQYSRDEPRSQYRFVNWIRDKVQKNQHEVILWKVSP